MPLRLSLLGPARPGGGPDTERPELVEREHPVRELLHDLFDPVVPTNTPPQLAKRGALAQDELEDPPHPTLGQGLGRSRGGLTTKVHLAADGRGLPLAIIVTPGNVNDSTVFDTVLDAARVPPGPRRMRSGPLKAGSARRARASGGTSPVSWHPRR
ncbi:hypothetical protein SRO_7558 [Streptomyces rochei]|nr:hypothetical protein SRO_0011 [Streptomyces rochei]BBC98734.1 hypothetical protein SRO_7558 [Streptomyces rochei]